MSACRKTLTLIALILVTAALGLAQALPAEAIAAGPAYQPSVPAGTPALTGWGVYIKQVSPLNAPELYSLTEFDVVPVTFRPLKLQSSMRTGFAACHPFWTLATVCAGAAAGGGIVGDGGAGSFSGDGIVARSLGRTKWFLTFAVSGLKNSLSDPTVVYKWGIGRTR